MNIGIDASRLNISEKTGTEWYSYYIIKNILNIDKHNQYFLFSKEKLSDEFLGYSNVKNIVLNWRFKYFWTIFKLSHELRKYKLDVFFAPAHYLPFCKCKKVVTWHDLGYEYYKEYYSKKQLISLFYGAKSLKKANAIITPSYFTKQDIIKTYQIDSNKIFVTHLGLDFNKYQIIFSQEEQKQILDKYNITKEYLIYIGRLESKKNIITLIKTFDYFKEYFNNDLELVLIGKNGYGFEEIEKNINNSKFKNDIKIIGWISEEDKVCLLQNAKIYINLSNFEGFGMTLLEAMFLKVPMLVSNLEVFKELGISDYCFCRNDYKDIATKIDTLIKNDILKNDIINKNYFESQKYSWKNTAQKTIDIFNNLK